MAASLKSPVLIITIVSLIGAFFITFLTLLLYSRCRAARKSPSSRRRNRHAISFFPPPNIARTNEEIERRRRRHPHHHSINIPLPNIPYSLDPPPAYLASPRRPTLASEVNLYSRLEDLGTIRRFCGDEDELEAIDAEILALRKWMSRLEAQTESVMAMDSSSDLHSSGRGRPPVYSSEVGSVETHGSRASRGTRPKRGNAKRQRHT